MFNKNIMYVLVHSVYPGSVYLLVFISPLNLFITHKKDSENNFINLQRFNSIYLLVCIIETSNNE